jgi:hypothetical protein
MFGDGDEILLNEPGGRPSSNSTANPLRLPDRAGVGERRTAVMRCTYAAKKWLRLIGLTQTGDANTGVCGGTSG